MKRIKYHILLFALIISTFSCSNFLDSELNGEYSSGTFFTSEANAIAAVTGIYNSLYNNYLWVFTDVASDDAVKGGNAGDQADISDIDNFSATSDNGIIATFWEDTYETISQANNAINYIPNIDMDTELQTRLIGEAKFLRAYSYFNLVNIFGEVPLKLLPQNSSETINIGLSDIESIYTQIESDLTDAIEVLPVNYATETGRITKGAAFALLAKVNLYQEKYTECLTNIDSVQSLNIYSLETNYNDLFVVGAEESNEIIFGLCFINNDVVSLGNWLNVWFAPSIEGGYYFNAPTQNYVDVFSEQTSNGDDDPRLDASIGRDGKTWFNDSTFYSATWSEATGYLVKKYNEDYAQNKIDGIAKSQSQVPYHIIRYADVLLMKAEALNELDNSSAKAAINEIRIRAGLSETTATSQSDLRQVIRNERRKELAFEFNRFFDLMRYGQSTATTALPELPWTSERYYYPIPQSEIDSNTALE